MCRHTNDRQTEGQLKQKYKLQEHRKKIKYIQKYKLQKCRYTTETRLGGADRETNKQTHIHTYK